MQPIEAHCRHQAETLRWLVGDNLHLRRLILGDTALCLAGKGRSGSHACGDDGTIHRAEQGAVDHDHRVPPSGPVVPDVVYRIGPECDLDLSTDIPTQGDAHVDPLAFILVRAGIETDGVCQ